MHRSTLPPFRIRHGFSELACRATVRIPRLPDRNSGRPQNANHPGEVHFQGLVRPICRFQSRAALSLLLTLSSELWQFRVQEKKEQMQWEKPLFPLCTSSLDLWGSPDPDPDPFSASPARPGQ